MRGHQDTEMQLIKKRDFIVFFFVLLVVGTSLVSAELSSDSVCCEKTKSGAYCQNTVASECATGEGLANPTPTSCETTSFCKLGTCYDSKEGICLENVPQKVCQANGGTWSDKSANQLSQCKLGCCLLADQASFVTMTRCKSLSTFFGIRNMDFRTSVSTEVDCVNLANSQDEGACVSFEGGIKTCRFTTRGDCGGEITTTNRVINASDLNDLTGKYFYPDLLCSNEELGVPNAARQVSTKCYGGKVYWYDSAGNRENVYSSDKDASWNNGRVADPDEICAKTGESKTCGNCDYLAGSRCADWSSASVLKNIFGGIKPANVDHYCRTTTCTDRNGKSRMNGESWCVYDGEVGEGRDAVGSRHFREICIDGGVVVEACEDYRNQICVHSGIQTSKGEYSVSACRVNRWQDCTAQDNKADCENNDARDCMWVEEVDGIILTERGRDTATQRNSFNNPVSQVSGAADTTTQGIQAVSSTMGVVGSFTGNVIKNIVGSGIGEWEQSSISNNWRTVRSEADDNDGDGYLDLCVPLVPPGLDFWQQGDSNSMCGQATATCTVKVTVTEKKNALTGKTEKSPPKLERNDCLELKNGEFVVKPEWAARVNAICSSMGDCGASANLNGVFVNKGYSWRYRNESFFFIESDIPLLKQDPRKPITGEVVKNFIVNEEYQLKEGDIVYIKA